MLFISADSGCSPFAVYFFVINVELSHVRAGLSELRMLRPNKVNFDVGLWKISQNFISLFGHIQ